MAKLSKQQIDHKANKAKYNKTTFFLLANRNKEKMIKGIVLEADKSLWVQILLHATFCQLYKSH